MNWFFDRLWKRTCYYRPSYQEPRALHFWLCRHLPCCCPQVSAEGVSMECGRLSFLVSFDYRGVNQMTPVVSGQHSSVNCVLLGFGRLPVFSLICWGCREGTFFFLFHFFIPSLKFFNKPLFPWKLLSWCWSLKYLGWSVLMVCRLFPKDSVTVLPRTGEEMEETNMAACN